jgi:calcineurin-like phosphoesterase family protein
MEHFISDEHIGHANIIRYVNRPFTSVDEMTSELRRRHNLAVNPKDHTWHLGDLFWNSFGEGPAIAYMNSLNGEHSVILGNHDELLEESAALRRCFREVIGSKDRPGMAVIPVPGFKKQKLVMSHYAQRVWLDSHKGSWHIYGHSHAEISELGKSFDVGVDSKFMAFAPLSMNELIVEMSKREQAHKIVQPWPGKEQDDRNNQR